MADIGGPLESKVSEWLKKSGYPLEMRVAAVFRRAGFEVVQSTFLKDLETDKPREVDVIATYQHECGNGERMIISFVVECKTAATDKPWVVFKADRQADLDDVFWLSWFPSAGVSSKGLARLDSRCKELIEMAFFRPSKGIGYAVTESFREKSDKDKAYSAILKAVSSTRSLLSLTERRNKPRFRVVEFAFPLVVTDTICLTAEMQDEQLRLQRVDEMALPQRQWPPCVVRLLRLDSLEEFAAAAIKDARRFIGLLAPELISAMEFPDNQP